jgi:selT/selW/selH-like putative selenoprotein
LAAEIEQRFPEATVELIPSSGGRFEVVADGKPVFEKSKVRRHAEPGEVIASLERVKGRA